VSADAALLSIPGLLPRLLRPLDPLHPARRRREPAELIDEIAASGLMGRGGAGFPTAIKLRAVAESGRQAVVVANGTEREPASAKDKYLLSHNPHLVIAGALAAARAVGAKDVILALGVQARPAQARTAAAVEAWRRSRGPRIKLVTTPDRFVAGEESALVHFLNGGQATPTFVPPRPSDRGVDGRPTLVQNVETLANIALIDHHGADWFREVGTSAEPGTVLVTVSGAIRAAGVHEVEIGTPLERVVGLSGPRTSVPAAVLVGGYFGNWLGVEALGLPLSEAGLRSAGASLGARAVVVLGSERCGLVETARILEYLANESAGQCGPCRFGLRAMADTATSLARCEAGASVVDRLRSLAALVDGRGACAHPDGASRFLRSALTVFASEVDLHLRNRCSAGLVR